MDRIYHKFLQNSVNYPRSHSDKGEVCVCVGGGGGGGGGDFSFLFLTVSVCFMLHGYSLTYDLNT